MFLFITFSFVFNSSFSSFLSFLQLIILISSVPANNYLIISIYPKFIKTSVFFSTINMTFYSNIRSKIYQRFLFVFSTLSCHKTYLYIRNKLLFLCNCLFNEVFLSCRKYKMTLKFKKFRLRIHLFIDFPGEQNSHNIFENSSYFKFIKISENILNFS